MINTIELAPVFVDGYRSADGLTVPMNFFIYTDEEMEEGFVSSLSLMEAMGYMDVFKSWTATKKRLANKIGQIIVSVPVVTWETIELPEEEQEVEYVEDYLTLTQAYTLVECSTKLGKKEKGKLIKFLVKSLNC